jgi:hypothetical protein
MGNVSNGSGKVSITVNVPEPPPLLEQVATIKMPLSYVKGLVAIIGPTSHRERQSFLRDTGSKGEADYLNALNSKHCAWDYEIYKTLKGALGPEGNF